MEQGPKSGLWVTQTHVCRCTHTRHVKCQAWESLPQRVACGRYCRAFLFIPGDPINLSQPWCLSFSLSHSLYFPLHSILVSESQKLNTAFPRLEVLHLAFVHTHALPSKSSAQSNLPAPFWYKCIQLLNVRPWRSITTLCGFFSCFERGTQLELIDNGCYVSPCFLRFCFK